MNKKVTLLFLSIGISLIFSENIAKAQNMNPTSAQPLNTYLNNFVQPPPNAASLGKYADYPVGYYTGVPNISIPIYDLKDGSISLPISLSYHASGIRVSELASWVGLGWALNATGVINRTVRGAPDEGSHKATYAPNGYYLSHGLFSLMNLPYPLPSSNNLSDPQFLFYTTTVNGILNGGTDCEPDLYTFNFNGHTGKFVFDENGVPRLLEDDNLKIKVIPNAAHTYFNAWVITTEDGVQYYFGENHTTEMVRPVTVNHMEDADDAAPSSWYLTRIYDPNTKETATFNYVNEGYSYYDLGPESKLYGGSGGIQTDVSYATDNELINQHYVDNLILTSVQGLKLTSIVTNNYTVKFIANNVRSDVDSTLSGNWRNPDGSYSNVPHGKACSLDSIKIYTNQNNKCIKEFVLGHGYFSSSPSGTGPAVLYSLSGDNHDTQRLKLTTVTEIAGDGSIQKPPYVLTYQESFQLPRRLSYDQDHWGFSNNTAGNYNNYFTPPTFTSFSTYAGGARRHPKWPDMSAFTLTNIQDPLGATTAFIYGPNSANNGADPDLNPAPADTLVGGLRIQQIAVTDNVSGNVKLRSFSYNIPGSSQTSGDLRHFPIYLIQLQNEYFQNINDPNTTLGYNTGYLASSYIQPGSNGTGVQILKQSQGIVPMQDANGNHIVYSYVKETFGSGGIGGYKQYHFAVQPETATASNSKLNYNNYMALETMNFSPPENGYFAYYGNGHLNDTTADPAMLPLSLGQNYSSVSTSMYYPFAPKQADFYSGKLLEEDTYDAGNNLLESVTNAYATNYHENFWIRGLKAYVQNLIPITYKTVNVNGTDQRIASYNTPAIYNALTFYKLHTGVAHLISTLKKTYNSGSSVARRSAFGYESPAHTLKTSDTTTDSQGNVLINKYYYSFDYSNSATTDNVFGKMKARNLLAPARIDNFKNGNLISEKVTKFYDFAASSADTLINAANIYTLETTAPLTPVQANVSMNWSASQGTLLPNSNYLPSKVNFTYDGNSGKMITEQLTNDKAEGIMWGSQLKLPVAVADNAVNTPALKEFYFEGFEESTASNLYTGIGHTGTKSMFAPYTVTWALPNTRSYVITYWYFVNGAWKMQLEQPFTGSLALSGGTLYDDIRIYPIDANMVTYTYDAAGDLTSSTDAKGATTYYEYDSLQRLLNIKNKDGNIVKSFCYNYAGQASGCNVWPAIYTNAIQSQVFTTSCGNGYTGIPVSYTVPAAQYNSTLSQADADNKALADLQANGQIYANLHGSCVQNVGVPLSNSTGTLYQVNFSNNSFNVTFSPTTANATFQVPAGTYSVNIYTNGAYVNHTITCGSQSVFLPRYIFTGVIVSTGNGLSISIN